MGTGVLFWWWQKGIKCICGSGHSPAILKAMKLCALNVDGVTHELIPIKLWAQTVPALPRTPNQKEGSQPKLRKASNACLLLFRSLYVQKKLRVGTFPTREHRDTHSTSTKPWISPKIPHEVCGGRQSLEALEGKDQALLTPGSEDLHPYLLHSMCLVIFHLNRPQFSTVFPILRDGAMN